jgi:hypothetical protein
MDDAVDDPAAMTPAQRRHEIAVILARGVLRLGQNRLQTLNSQSSRTAESTAKILENDLDENAESRPHVLAR